MDEILMFIGISKSKKEVRLLDERLKSKVFKYKNKKRVRKKFKISYWQVMPTWSIMNIVIRVIPHTVSYGPEGGEYKCQR